VTDHPTPEANVAAARAPRARKHGPEWVVCATCKARWTGLSACHCTGEGCHRTFTSISAFDKHRTDSHVTGRYCLDPAAAGLVPVTKRYWSGWALPGERPPQDEL
jgi:hypothetical protein